MMDRQSQIIQDMNRIVEAIDSFKSAKTPDKVIVSRIYHLCKFEREEAQKQIDMKLDEMEREYNGT